MSFFICLSDCLSIILCLFLCVFLFVLLNIVRSVCLTDCVTSTFPSFQREGVEMTQSFQGWIVGWSIYQDFVGSHSRSQVFDHLTNLENCAIFIRFGQPRPGRCISTSYVFDSDPSFIIQNRNCLRYNLRVAYLVQTCCP